MVGGMLLALIVVAIVGAGGHVAYRGVLARRLRERVQTSYVATECTVLTKEVKMSSHSGRVHGRDRHRDLHAVFEPLVTYRYAVQGRGFEGNRFSVDPPVEHERERVVERLNGYEVGGKYPCWYDPDAPGEAVLNKP